MNQSPPETDAHLGFTIWIRPRPGLHAVAETDFIRRLEDYLADHDLTMNGAPLRLVIRSDTRSLTDIDQVDLLDWLIEDPVPAVIRIGPLTTDTELPAQFEDGFVHADRADLTLFPLTWLYRIRRITAEQYLQILGGYVRPVPVH